MKKLIALILVLSMVFALCGCGNSKEIKAIMEVKRSLLRPDTFILRYAYSFSGCPFEEETGSNYDKLKDIKVNLEIFFYTCENASGTVIDNCCALYDMDSGIVYYDLEETKKFLSGKGAWDDPISHVLYELGGYLGLDNKSDFIEERKSITEQWISKNKLVMWDNKKIDKMNAEVNK